MGSEEESHQETQPGSGRLSQKWWEASHMCVSGGARATGMVLGKRREKWEVGTARDREGEKGQKGPSLSPARTGHLPPCPRSGK